MSAIVTQHAGSIFDSVSPHGVSAILDALPAAVFWTENGKLGCNKAAERLTGYARTELSSPDFFFLQLFQSSAPDVHSLFHKDPPAEFPVCRDFTLHCQDGTLKSVEITCSAPGSGLWTMQDVTELRTLQQERSAIFKRFKSMAETSTDAFMLADRSGRIVEANDICLQLYGYSRAELVAMSVGDLETPETRVASVAQLQNAMRQGHVRFPSRHLAKDGRVIDIGLSVVLLPGEPYSLIFLRDITDRMLAERKVAENEALLKAVFDSVPFDFFALDCDGRYTMVSSGTAGMWGDPTGKTVAEFTAGTPFERYTAQWQDNNRRALAGENIDQETVYNWGGGDRIVLEIIGPVRDSQQRILGSFGVNLDVTQQRQTQKALEQSEERYRRFSALTSDYAFCFSRKPDGLFHFRWLGGAFQEITGYSEEEIFQHGRRFAIVHPDDRERVVSRLFGLQVGQSLTEEYRIVCKNGETRWIRGAYHCEAGDSPDELLLFGASRNITGSKENELALKNIEEIFRLFLEHSPAYLIFKDESQRVIRLSRNFESLFGRPLTEMMGKTVKDFYPPGLAATIMRDDTAVLKEGRPIHTEEVLNGRVYSSTKFAIPQKGKPSLLATIKTEITARKEAEAALRLLNEVLDRRVAERTSQLQAAVMEQEAFSYSVSHDLRAPLRHINSFSAILLEDFGEFLPPQGRDYLVRICKATNRMGVLIDNLLELSRVSRAQVNRSTVDLSTLAAKIALMFREIEPERQVELQIAPDLWAECDKNLVRQLLENLLGNAWKYTSQAEVARIEVGQLPSEEGPVYFVRDNGAGFEMAYQEKLFAPFQRLHGAEFEGNGIGLATAQRIVQRHGGTIWAEGEVGKGAQFFFTLPG
ncbi:MAG TPA: PAS domain S-box protein [Geomonas sp.]|nr:PAS domain S-box protein [Geomonas sp.]